MAKAIEQVQLQCGKVSAKSPIYETEPWGVENQTCYLNMCIAVETELSPATLLATIHSIEKELGRERLVKWASRTIDIDILFYDQLVIESPDLTIPHPLLHQRSFVLDPLADIAPNLMHPILGKSVLALRDALRES